jgi:repressor LexA
MSNRRTPPRKKGDPNASREQLDLWGAPVAIEKPTPAAPAPVLPAQAKLPEKSSVTHLNTSQKKPQPQVKSKSEPAPQRAPVKVTVSQPASHTHSAGSPPALTRRQHQILDHMRRREDRGALPPSLSELCGELGVVSRGSLHKQIAALVDAGLIEPMHGKHRGVRLQRAQPTNARTLPLAGAIAAGHPIEALPRDEQIAVPDWMYPSEHCYALRVRGDSMRDIGILDGDVVVVEPRGSARNGEVVVALIEGVDATLKRIEQVPGEVRLYAENPDFAPQRYRPDQVQIQGVLVAALRRYFR